MQGGELRRELGVFGATMMGMGAMIGTGVFVSIGIAAGVTGPSVVLAIGLAAVVAACNALSSAQLAASLPVSGGTYEYGYAYLNPWLGFSAGWMFLCAKTASAATAALGFAGYLVQALGADVGMVPVALAATLVMTIVVLAGIRRSNRANVAIVTVTILALAAFIIGGAPTIGARGAQPWVPFFAAAGGAPLPGLLEATALMFVAFTGYARIATLGEEVIAPRRTIPRAIITTLIVSALLYLAVAIVGISTVGADGLAGAVRQAVAPLEVAARSFTNPWIAGAVAIGAMTAMLGVLLNLLLGLSRVLLAMGRRRDMPAAFAAISAGADRQRQGDMVIQRLQRADLLCDHQRRGAPSAEGGAALSAGHRVDRPRLMSVPGILGRTQHLADRTRADRRRARVARRGATSRRQRQLVEQRIQSACQADAVHDLADRKQCTGDIRTGR